jgi:hypothetical protein
VSIETSVRELAVALGRPIVVDGEWITQQCPKCQVQLKLRDTSEVRTQLRSELFSFFDQHRCYAKPDEDTMQRAERASVLAAERSIALESTGDRDLAERAERESVKLATWVDRFTRTGR